MDAIEVDATNRLPLRTAELVSPDGQTTPATYLHVNPSPSVALSFPHRAEIPMANIPPRYNAGIQRFPAVLFAASFGFAPKTFFDLGDERATVGEAPAVKF